MAEVFFYQLSQRPLEVALADLLEKTRARGWRALVRGTDTARLARLDALLWTRQDEGFLPHGLEGGEFDADQPVLLTCGDENANEAQILMLIDGARADVPRVREFERACLLFDGDDEAQLGNARADWKAIKDAGLPAQYWAIENGQWKKKAENAR